MLVGKYNHSIDEKGRLMLPKKLKEEMGDVVYIIRGFENCLSVYSKGEFEQYVRSLNNLPFTQKQTRDMQRLGLSSVVEIDVDKQGRILIPTQTMQEFKIGSDVVVVGLLNHLEIWNKSAWESYEEENSSKFEEIAEKLPF